MAKKMKFGNKELKSIEDWELKCLENDLLSYEEWLCEGPTEGKINNTMKRMFNEWIPKLRAANIAIPSSDEDLVNLITSQPAYKNRKQREEVENDIIVFCKDSNKRSKLACPFHRTKSTIYKKGTAPTEECDVH